MNYIPILKYKDRIDISAYTKMDMNNMNEVIPLIEVFQEDRLMMEKINKDKVFYCSILTERSLDFEHAVNLFLEAKNYHTNFIPVINSDYNFTSSSKKELMKSAKNLFKNFDNVAIKINGINKFYLPDNLENILFLLDDFTNVTVFLDVDFAFKHDNTTMIKSFTNAIGEIHSKLDDEIVNFVLCGSIISVSSKGLKTFDGDGQYNIRKNSLLEVYNLLKSTFPELNIKYGDYTIDEKNMFTGDAGGGTFFPSIKFTNPEGDICIYKSEERNEFEKYKKIAKLIQERKDYTQEHCPGCEYISKIINGETGGKGTGSPSTWKIHMMIHHIKTMIGILS